MDGSWRSPEIQRAVARDKANRLSALQRQALDKAIAVAAMMKDKYMVQKVILYGSLREGRFDARSDIDLMVHGFSGSFWQMYSEAGMLADPFPLSIVLKKDAMPSLIKHAEEKGMEL